MTDSILTPEKLSEWLQIAETIAKNLLTRASSESPETFFEPAGDVQLPVVCFENSTLKVGETAIPLISRPKTERLVRAFLGKTDQFLSKETIMEKVYELRPEASVRMQQSHSQNLLKLMSRSRRFLTEACDGVSGTTKIEWFPFDKEQQSWKLYEFRSVGTALSPDSETEF